MRKDGSTHISYQSGFSLVEALIAMLVLSVLALGMAHSTILAYKIEKRNLRNSVAQELAVRKMEELAAINPAFLDGNDSASETVTSDGIPYTRTTSVTVNDDNSRTVTISVAGARAELGGTATIANTFALWGRN